MLSSIAQRLMSSMIVVLLIVEIVYTWAHPRFQKELPNIANGEKIPGKPVLGHSSNTYIQDLDVFGEAFRKAGFRWTKEFCQEDSDGDGQSNGHELGDPFCCYIKVSSFYIYFLYFIFYHETDITFAFLSTSSWFYNMYIYTYEYIKDDTTRYRGATNFELSDPGNSESKSKRAAPCEFCVDKCADNGATNRFPNSKKIIYSVVIVMIITLS